MHVRQVKCDTSCSLVYYVVFTCTIRTTCCRTATTKVFCDHVARVLSCMQAVVVEDYLKPWLTPESWQQQVTVTVVCAVSKGSTNNEVCSFSGGARLVSNLCERDYRGLQTPGVQQRVSELVRARYFCEGLWPPFTETQCGRNATSQKFLRKN